MYVCSLPVCLTYKCSGLCIILLTYYKVIVFCQSLLSSINEALYVYCINNFSKINISLGSHSAFDCLLLAIILYAHLLCLAVPFTTLRESEGSHSTFTKPLSIPDSRKIGGSLCGILLRHEQV